jgi:hypothetical protein
MPDQVETMMAEFLIYVVEIPQPWWKKPDFNCRRPMA